MLFYCGLIISLWARRTRKLIIVFIKVAHNCHGKRNNRGAKERDSRQRNGGKWWSAADPFTAFSYPMVHLDSSSRPPRPLLCREDIVISFAARLFLLPWQLWATALYQLFTRIPCSPTLERKIKTTVLPQQVDVPKFWGWRLTDNLFFILIFISYSLTVKWSWFFM